MIQVVKSSDPRIKKRDMLISINNSKIEDWLDFSHYNNINIKRRIRIKTNDFYKTFTLNEQESLNIDLAEPSWRQCKNDCEYCFIKGLPEGARKSLFFRDDDFRLSFLHGNFISMTNLDRDDFNKIFKLKLSPLYVSVHSTNPKLRSEIYKNGNAANIIKQIKYLIDHDIIIHSQIVVLPGINDGSELIRTINDLLPLFPGVASIGIVPIGRTKKNQYLRPVDKSLAQGITGLTRNINYQYRKKLKKGIIYAADEFFLIAGQKIPPTIYYDDLPQYENGIGMIRNFLDAIQSWRFTRRLKKRILILTGGLAYPFLLKMEERMIDSGFMHSKDIKVQFVENSFFGPTVTVAGLLGGKDFRRAICKEKMRYDFVILPPNCTNSNNKLIDNQDLPSRAVVSPPDFKGFIRWLLSL